MEVEAEGLGTIQVEVEKMEDLVEALVIIILLIYIQYLDK
jgi:hypothetical protein